MKLSPKIMVACAVALLLITFSVVSGYKQSKEAREAAAFKALLTSEEGEWIPPPDYVPYEENSLEGMKCKEILSKQLFSNFIVLREAGELNDQTTLALANELTEQIIEKDIGWKPYTVADLRVTTVSY